MAPESSSGKSRSSRHRMHDHRKEDGDDGERRGLEQEVVTTVTSKSKAGKLMEVKQSREVISRPSPSKTLLERQQDEKGEDGRGHKRRQNAAVETSAVEVAASRSSKRWKGAGTDGPAVIGPQPPSPLDRWDGGHTQIEDNSAVAVSDSNKVDSGHITTGKESGVDGETRNRRSKIPTSSSEQRAITVIDFPEGISTDAINASEPNIRIKNKVSRRRDIVDSFELNSERESEKLESLKLVADVIEDVGTGYKKGGSKRKIDVETVYKEVLDGEVAISGSHGHGKERDRRREKSGESRDADTFKVEKERHTRDSEQLKGKSSSIDTERYHRSVDDKDARESSQELERHQRTSNQEDSKHQKIYDDKEQRANEWKIQEDLRNPDLEKELENRIRRRKEESGERDRWRDDDRDREGRRYSDHREDKVKDVKYKEERSRRDRHAERHYREGSRPAEGRSREDKYYDSDSEYRSPYDEHLPHNKEQKELSGQSHEDHFNEQELKDRKSRSRDATYDGERRSRDKVYKEDKAYKDDGLEREKSASSFRQQLTLSPAASLANRSSEGRFREDRYYESDREYRSPYDERFPRGKEQYTEQSRSDRSHSHEQDGRDQKIRNKEALYDGDRRPRERTYKEDKNYKDEIADRERSRPQVPGASAAPLPPPPPFRPGIDNPSVINGPNGMLEDGSSREGRMDRKHGVQHRRNDAGGPADSWRGVAMNNWNRGQGPGAYPPFAPQFMRMPGGGFPGMGQQYPGPPMFGPGGIGRPPMDMGFSGGRFMGPGNRIGDPEGFHGHGHNGGWRGPGEGDDGHGWEGAGSHGDELRHGHMDWDRGTNGGGRPWDREREWEVRPRDGSGEFMVRTHGEPPLHKDASCMPSQDLKVGEAKGTEVCMADMENLSKPTASPILLTSADTSDAHPEHRKSNEKAIASMKALLSSLDISAELAGAELYAQYCDFVSGSKEIDVMDMDPEESDSVSDDDYVLEVNSGAKTFLSSSSVLEHILPSVPADAFKVACSVYKKYEEESRLQKSARGSFVLPFDASCRTSSKLKVDTEYLDGRSVVNDNVQMCGLDEKLVEVELVSEELASEELVTEQSVYVTKEELMITTEGMNEDMVVLTSEVNEKMFTLTSEVNEDVVTLTSEVNEDVVILTRENEQGSVSMETEISLCCMDIRKREMVEEVHDVQNLEGNGDDDEIHEVNDEPTVQASSEEVVNAVCNGLLEQLSEKQDNEHTVLKTLSKVNHLMNEEKTAEVTGDAPGQEGSGIIEVDEAKELESSACIMYALRKIQILCSLSDISASKHRFPVARILYIMRITFSFRLPTGYLISVIYWDFAPEFFLNT